MYRLLSGISYVVRWLACSFTIGQIDLFENSFLNFIVPDGVIYLILLAITRLTVGTVVYDRLGNDDKYIGCISYFLFYFPFMLIMWGLLGVLTWAGLLPIRI